MGHEKIVASDGDGSKLDTVIELLLGTLLLFMPLAFGVVHAWSEAVVLAVTAVIFMCFLLRVVIHPSRPFVWTWAYVPIFLFLLCVVLQLIPVPASVLNIISPNTVALKTQLLGDLPDAAMRESVLERMTISFYPNATMHDLRLVLAVTAIFVVVVNTFRKPAEIERLLKTIMLIGGAIAMLALAQDLFGNGKIFWRIQTVNTLANAGPFVNHSCYAQFMNLSIGAAIAWVCVKVAKDMQGKAVTVPVTIEYISSPKSKPVWLVLVLIILGIATIFLCLSRGGMLSVLAAACLTALVICSRKSMQGSGWIMALIAFAAFVCILTIGFDSVYDRFSSLYDPNAYQNRLQILKDMVHSFRMFPLTGTGLGTHAVVYPMFGSIVSSSVFRHAENEYAQTLTETGLTGLLALVGLGVIIWWMYAKHIRKGTLPICSAAYGMGFGICAILIHSLTDFGQHRPANSFLTTIFCALMIAIGRTEKTVQVPQRKSKLSRVLPVMVLILAAGLWTWVVAEANNARLAEGHWEKTLAAEKSLKGKNWAGDQAEYDELISNALAAANYQPINIQYRHWLNYYRWRSMARLTDSDTTITFDTESEFSVDEIVSEFYKAMTLCPTFGATYCITGQIERYILGNPEGAEMIQKGFRLAPADPMVCLVAGSLDIEEGQIEESYEKLKKATLLSHSFFQKVLDLYINTARRPDMAIKIADGDIGNLIYISALFEKRPEYDEFYEAVNEKLLALMVEKCSQPNAGIGDLLRLSDLYKKLRNYEAMIECYQKALRLDYGRTSLRMKLALSLASENRVAEAIEEAKICLRLAPGNVAAKNLIGKLSVRTDYLKETVGSN